VWGAAEGGADGGQAGEYGVGTSGAKFVGGVGAGGDSPAKEAGVVGGGDVERGIADEERGGGVSGELAEDVVGECGLGLEPSGVFSPKVAVEERGETEVGADEARRRAEFVGEDGEPGAAGVQGFEEFACAWEQDDIVEHRRVPVGPVNGESLRDARGPDEGGDGVFESSADGRANVGQRWRGQAELAHRVAVAAMDRGEMIDERAVEVEQDGGKSGHERELAQRFDLAGGGVTSEVARCLRVVFS